MRIVNLQCLSSVYVRLYLLLGSLLFFFAIFLSVVTIFDFYRLAWQSWLDSIAAEVDRSEGHDFLHSLLRPVSASF